MCESRFPERSKTKKIIFHTFPCELVASGTPNQHPTSTLSAWNAKWNGLNVFLSPLTGEMHSCPSPSYRNVGYFSIKIAETSTMTTFPGVLTCPILNTNLNGEVFAVFSLPTIATALLRPGEVSVARYPFQYKLKLGNLSFCFGNASSYQGKTSTCRLTHTGVFRIMRWRRFRREEREGAEVRKGRRECMA